LNQNFKNEVENYGFLYSRDKKCTQTLQSTFNDIKNYDENVQK